jgi:hypothetical protein
MDGRCTGDTFCSEGSRAHSTSRACLMDGWMNVMDGWMVANW